MSCEAKQRKGEQKDGDFPQVGMNSRRPDCGTPLTSPRGPRCVPYLGPHPEGGRRPRYARLGTGRRGRVAAVVDTHKGRRKKGEIMENVWKRGDSY